ncbi:TasA family protein [Paenibacillus donghaensis]|uniref:Cell division protein FtsN n=1 Tax=Paenibacillus donghaensis TaxID=414771 RepID=A0A2Z2KY40_9BACL|nr:TasA family protein [Paenibacillus donghaensis]ASA25298.1 hypothetical protein B9T62_33945 [Paenibacillus donghaensis]
MNVKKTLGLGVVSAALGLTLIGGGTFAYFSDTAQTNAAFNNGTLSLTSDPSIFVNLNNLKPGDTINKTFWLKNDGSLDITKVLLKTVPTVNDLNGNNGSHNLKEDIIVTIMINDDKNSIPVLVKSLADLEKITPDLVKTGLWGEKSGIKANTSDKLYVSFFFKENLTPQNYYQGDELNLTWTFEASQGAGVYK